MSCNRQGEPLDRCAAKGDQGGLVDGACVTCGRKPRQTVVVEVRRFDACFGCGRPGDCAARGVCALGVSEQERAIDVQARTLIASEGAA